MGMIFSMHFIAITIKNVTTQNHCDCAFFVVFSCMRPSTILKHKITFAWSLCWYPLHVNIISVTTKNHSGRGLFSIFYCKRPSTTLRHRIIVVVLSSRHFIARDHNNVTTQSLCLCSLLCTLLLETINNFETQNHSCVSTLVLFIARKQLFCKNKES